MWYSPQHQQIVYHAPDPARIAASIAGAKVLNPVLVSVPATLFSMQLARVMGLPVPSPTAINDYDWPIQPGRTPLTHQKYMTDFHILHPRSFNFSDMGTMKTAALLWAADYLMRAGVIRKALILSPLSTLKRVWDDEIFRMFVNRRRAVILHGSRDERLKRLEQDVDFYIINHDGVTIGSQKSHTGVKIGPVAAAIAARRDIDCIIGDEASAYKDHTTLRSKVLRNVIRDKPYIWLASGTPTPQAPTDAHGLAVLMGIATESYNAFRGRTMMQLSPFKWKPRANASEVVRQTLVPAVRFTRDECIELPPCVIETRDVELSPTQEKAYRELKKDLSVTLGNGRVVTAVNEAVLRTKLIQIACGAVYGPDREILKTDASPRIKVLKEVIDEAAAKVLVFAPLTSVVNLLYAELRATYGDQAVARIYGGTSSKARDDIFARFDSDEQLRTIVADPGTMSHGLTLVAANTIVWFGPTDKNETYEQANARIPRPGQKNKMLIVRLASTAPEREIYRRLHESESMQGAILKLVEEDR